MREVKHMPAGTKTNNPALDVPLARRPVSQLPIRIDHGWKEALEKILTGSRRRQIWFSRCGKSGNTA